MFRKLMLVAVTLGQVTAQQVYIPGEGPQMPTWCQQETNYAATPTYTFDEFSFTQTETTRIPSSVTPPPTPTTYAAPYSSLSHLVPGLSTTTWGNWNASDAAATDTTDPYGQAAWSSMWERASLANFTRGIYSTTVSPTPVPTSELILPPPDYLRPPGCYQFPPDFLLGVAGSAAQVEGAIADEGRSPTLMELLGAGQQGSADNYAAIEHYYLYKQDMVRIASMGVKYYSFSIPWTRILPFAVQGSPVNQAGLDHYDDLINFALEIGLIPVVTLIHFDTPLVFYGNLSDIALPPLIGYVNGAYQNETFEDSFVHYGKILMTHFADRVPVWFTFNEPLLYSHNGKSIDTVIKSHARLYHFYHDVVNGTGQVSIKFNDNFGVPRDPSSPADVHAANHFNDFQLATFANPIFLGQDYPEAYKMTIPDHVPLSPSDLAYINGTADFFSIDAYTATVISPPVSNSSSSISSCASNSSHPLYPYCVSQSTTTTPGWNIGYRSESYVYLTPTYLRTFLSYLYNTFRKPVMITEFGFPVYGEAGKESNSDRLFDSPRSEYYVSFLNEVLRSIWEDGVHVAGAFAWSWADNWEFGDYGQRFGMQTVDREGKDGKMRRGFKKSFFDVVDFVEGRRMRV